VSIQPVASDNSLNHENTPKVLVVIPARGGSKGIPRKNLRPLAGYPLIYYSISAALGAKHVTDVVVSTEDDEISMFSKRFGASIVARSQRLADDLTTLDPVIEDAVVQSELGFGCEYDFVVTVQPTSPLIRSIDIDNSIELIFKSKSDTVISVVDDRHLRWGIESNKAKPLYQERVNRQQLAPSYRETGAVVVCSRAQIKKGSRIGLSVNIYEVPHEFSFDVDTYSDFYLCEAMLTRKKIVISVVGYAQVGLGHAFRGIMLAHELVQYDIVFVCERKSDLAIDYIRSHNYAVAVAEDGELAETLISLSPDLIINDILDTSLDFMEKLSSFGCKMVNFEDLGKGAKMADLVVNALYPHQSSSEKVLVGEKYFCLRDEFLFLDSSDHTAASGSVNRVLVTFGGVDEGNITEKVLSEIAEFCTAMNISVDVITGPGYAHGSSLDEFMKSNTSLSCNIVKETKRISEYMVKADIAITSAGRTVLELAALNILTMVIAQNDREMTHTFASIENGICNLGHRANIREKVIVNQLKAIVQDAGNRKLMIEKMNKLDLKNGKSRVISAIRALIR